MAFVGGVAVAGLAALLLLKGPGETSTQPNFAVSPPMQAPAMNPMVPPQVRTYPYTYLNPNAPVPLPIDPSISQKLVQLEKYKVLGDKLRQENTLLKAQIQQMQFQMQQMRLNTDNNQRIPIPSELNITGNTLLSSPIVWAVGGMSLAIGGGVVVAGVLALFSPRERNARTVQVLHPYPSTSQHMAPARRAEFLPPHKEVKRVKNHHQYDDIY